MAKNDNDQTIMENISQAIKDAKKIEEGKIKTRPAKKLLDEL